MQFQIKGKVIYTYSARRLLYTLCFVLFCVIDQRTKTCSGLDGWLETFRDLTGVVMAVVIMSHYRLDMIKKYKVPYLVWSVIWIIGVVPAILWGRAHRPFFYAWCVLVIDVILFGYILIYTFINVVMEKNYPRLNKKLAAVWLVMMLLMIVSRSDYLWPFAYLVMFGCFYLTDFTREEQTDLLQGILDGLILAFFLTQGWCFVFRPFDKWDLRYSGVYTNCNISALFYLEVLAAVFAKIIYVNRINANKWVRVYYWLGAGVLLSFLFMTIGRTAWLTAFVMGLIFLACLKLVQKRKRFLVNGLILVMCACLTFPLCFAAVRYLPPIFHHPVWFWGEWSEEKVHSWDPWDSEKYIDLDEFMDAALGRIVESAVELFAQSPLTMRVEAAEADARTESDETDTRAENAVLTMEEAGDGVVVRKTIYGHYASNLNLRGYPQEEQGFQLTPYHWVGHAHNIYLQYGTDFGVPVMILFIILILWAGLLMTRRIRRECNEAEVANALFLLIPTLFGVLEYSWGVGSITILLLFVAWRKVICEEE